METKIEYWGNGTIKAVYSVDENGLKHGEAESYDYCGNLTEKGSYEHGKKEGQFLLKFKISTDDKDYLFDRYFLVKRTYKNDKPEGPYEEYYGVTDAPCFLKESGTYKDGEKNGPYKKFYWVSGGVHSSWESRNSVKEDDKIKEKGTYKNGKKDGIIEEYTNQGYLRSKITYVDGYTNGPQEDYYCNPGACSIDDIGKLFMKIEYVSHGDLNGIREQYFPDGKLESRDTWLENELHGASEIYSHDGRLLQKCNYKMGVLDGPFEGYHLSNGDFFGNYELSTYKYGILTGNYEEYLDSKKDKLILKAFYKDGKKDGPFEKYKKIGEDKNRKPIYGIAEKGLYKMGNKEGVWEEHPYSEEKRIVTYKNGSQNGLCERYINGQLIEKSTYKNGFLEGPYEKYENGKLVKKGHYHNHEFISDMMEKKQNPERKGLVARLKQIDEQMPPTELRKAAKRAEIAKFRKKYPKTGER